MKHAYILTDSIKGIDKTPNVRDHDLSIYFKVQGNQQAIGGMKKTLNFGNQKEILLFPCLI